MIDGRGEEPTLQNLIEFVDQETTLFNDPMFSRDAVKQYLYSKDRDAGKKRSSRYKIAATDVNENCESKPLQRQHQSCPLGDGNHDLDDCSIFKNHTVEERSKLLRTNKLCYGCYKLISPDHTAKTCTKRRTCSICNGKHLVYMDLDLGYQTSSYHHTMLSIKLQIIKSRIAALVWKTVWHVQNLEKLLACASSLYSCTNEAVAEVYLHILC